MDARTRHTLGKITAGIPARLHRSLTKTVVDTSEEEKVKAMLKDKSGRLSPQVRAYLTGLMRKGAFRSSEVVVDEKTVRELDRYHEREIAKARRSGALKDPKDDPWLKKRMARIKNQQNKK